MELNKYQQFGKIYTIRHPDSEKYYIGSSAQKYLSTYFQSSKSMYKSGKMIKSVKQIFAFGVDECYIELLEHFKCNDRSELERREGELIRLYKNDVVNKKNAGVNCKKDMKGYRKEYREANKETIIEYQKEYREANKGKTKEYMKEYYKEYKEAYKERMKIKYTCQCGSELRKSDKLRHEKTQKHCKYIKMN